MRRNVAVGPPETFAVTVPMVPSMRGFGDYAAGVVGLIYTYLLPLFCIVVGFWVVMVRVTDPLAWLLLLLMLGFSCLGMEGYRPGTFVGTYTQIFLSTWALSMFLFGIYFPERLKLDRRVPWLKWIVVGPLCLQLGLTMLGLLKSIFGITLIERLGAGSRIVTTIAVAVSFLIILYGLLSGRTGSFYDIAPWWLALTALLLLLLFPIMMGYIIVVRRAMDVSVVVRQGVQYAHATGGIRVLHFLLLVGVGLGVWLIIRNYGASVSAQLAFIVGGVALVPIIDLAAKRLRVWIDRRFFREAYNAEQILSELSDDVRTIRWSRPGHCSKPWQQR
jgi:sigma-B regulation protein RsbU (phosphoserine phosphatase)